MSVRLAPLPADGYAEWREAAVARLAALQFASTHDAATAETKAGNTYDAFMHTGLDTPGAHVLEAYDGARLAGWVWLRLSGGTCAVLDLSTDGPDDAASMRPVVEEWTREAGAHELTTVTVPGDAGLESFATAGELVLTAQNMALTLDAAVAPPEGLRLRPMTDDEYAVRSAVMEEDYIAQRVQSGESEEQARAISREQNAALLPDGLHSEGQRFFTAVDTDNAPVGMLWLDVSAPYAFIYDVMIDEPHRGRGFGRAVMNACAAWAQTYGSRGVALNVFGDNTIAMRLYDSLGYRVTRQHFRTTLNR